MYTSDCAKASALIQDYAKISCRKSDKDTRKAVMDLRFPTRSTRTTPWQQIEETFTRGELPQALSQLKAGKEEGPDGIDPDLIKHLSTKESSVLLTIINSSWLSRWCPQSGRSAYVVHFLKNGKGPADVGSYRPIAMTSTVGKVLERIIDNRLSWWFEEHSTLSPWQAGFRMRHSTIDQCLWLSQFISNLFQSTKRRCTIATFFDFTRAYDRVLRNTQILRLSQIDLNPQVSTPPHVSSFPFPQGTSLQYSNSHHTS